MVTGVSPVLEAFIPKMSPLSVRQPGWRLSQCSSIQKDISVVLRDVVYPPGCNQAARYLPERSKGRVSPRCRAIDFASWSVMGF
jgi:hypothetical protein